MEIAGLPLHPLVVHAAVVLIPLTALLAIGFAVLPRWRWLLRWPTAVASRARASAGVPGGLPERRGARGGQRPSCAAPLVQRARARAGELLLDLTIVLAVVVVVAALVLPGPVAALASGRARWPAGWCYADKVLPVLLVLAAAVVLVQVVLTGDSGARAVWGQCRLLVVGRLAARRAAAGRSPPGRPRCGRRRRPRRARTPGSPSPWVQPRGQLAGELVQVGERVDQRRRARRAPARRTGCRGCRRSSRRPGSASISADVEVCRPRPVTALTCADRAGRCRAPGR